MTNAFNEVEFRRTLGTFATGITVVSMVNGNGQFDGLTVNSFNSVSLDPPLILWSLSLTSPRFAMLQNIPHFAINILAADQIAIADRFATQNDDPFDGIETTLGLGGVPLLQGCVAILECRTETTYPGGDHLIFIGHVERLHYQVGEPLVYWNSGYRTLAY
ncbi:MAG: flavin reductase family protein [Candidatus Competibacteraceae bacterium]|jgi:flavin reductase (DIM6/NTAB) family NADH-FMN oxidoreductase RutF|nr:flavin reductase family protein [Candidatus Competibacteraceae bacterium]